MLLSLSEQQAETVRAWVRALLRVYISKAALARELGVTGTAILHIVTGRNAPSAPTLQQLAALVGLSEQALVNASPRQIEQVTTRLDPDAPRAPAAASRSAAFFPAASTNRRGAPASQPVPNAHLERALARVEGLYSKATLQRARHLSLAMDGTLRRTEKEWLRLIVFADTMMLKDRKRTE
jgi:plasmid maintenance system antidote protein VapI